MVQQEQGKDNQSNFTKIFGFGKKPERNLDDLKKEMQIDDHIIPIEELYKRLGVDPNVGLSPAEAKTRLEKYGPNSLTPPPTTPEWVKFCKNLFGGKSFVFW
ncbi:unnamed protein product [Cyprideis torosa]|uniref:Uncharacterized protein n=1 Tax=Cyprideis torosa TaxID=163714 RepID=A0A7R8ZRE4_9CRUS|nr:unnamed protein product [Cyprideis torosa]CAG0903531.1 unnamed protein product [Cyprideis torosa]